MTVISDTTDCMGTKQDGLKLDWKLDPQCNWDCWTNIETESGIWTLAAIRCGQGSYTAKVLRNKQGVAKKAGFPTRLDAQRHAEELIITFLKDTVMTTAKTLFEIEGIMK